MFPHFKQLGKQIFTYGLGDTINKIIGILLVPFFTRYLSPADYGVAGILAVTSALFIGLCDLGMSSAVVRFSRDEEDLKHSQLFSTGHIVMVTASMIVALVALFFAPQISELFFRTHVYSYIIRLGFFTIPVTMAATVPLLHLRLAKKAKTYVIFNVSKVLATIGLNAFLIIVLKRGINGLFEGPLIVGVLYILTLIIYTYKDNLFAFSYDLFKRMFAFGSPFILASVSIWIINWADRFILVKLTNLSEVGLYTLGYSMGMAIMLPVNAFTTAWLPFYISVFRQPNAKKIYASSLTYYSFVVGFFVLIIAIFSRDYFYFFTPEKFHNAYVIVPMITLAYALKGSFSITALSSTLSKKTVYQLITEVVAMAVNIALMFILIPIIGRIGAAWATVVAYAVLPVLIIFLTNKYYPIKYEYGRIFKVLIIGLAIYFLANDIYQPTVINIVIRFSLVMTYPLILFLTGFFKKGEIKRVLSIRDKILKRKNYDQKILTEKPPIIKENE